MIKAFAVGLVVFLATGACLFKPTRTSTIAAYPENLFTQDGQWQQPSKRPHEKFWAARTEHGFPWAWLVVDRGTQEPAWYAKRNDLLLVAYAGCAFALGGAAFVILARRSRPRVRDARVPSRE